MAGSDRDELAPETRLAHLQGDPFAWAGAVNPPVIHASTLLFRTVEELHTADPSYRSWRYARYGTPTSQAFEQAVAELEGAHAAVAFPSGLNAITTALSAYAEAGGHLLVTDNVYGPTREYCRDVLGRLGVTTEFFDPLTGAGIAALIRPETRAVLLESPGSLTFEVQDVPAIAAAAKARGVAVLIDNTWAAGLCFQPLRHGVDVSLHAATKYICGHSDAMLGVAACSEEAWPRIKRAAVLAGSCAGPDDLYLGLRGLRTLPARMARHAETGLALAAWLQGRPEVVRVLHPALPGDPGHALWKRDFTGTSGLFAFELAPVPARALAAMVEPMALFRMGFSWGGFESLILPVNPRRQRSAVPWTAPGPVLRISAGLERVDDLIADLERGFERLAAAQRE
jgi:cystathionine beta-lyase